MARTQSDDQPRKARPKRRWVRRFLLAVIWVTVVGATTVIYLLRSTPEDYKQFQAFLESHTEQQITDIAVGVENKFSALLAAGGGNFGGDLTQVAQLRSSKINFARADLHSERRSGDGRSSAEVIWAQIACSH